MVEMLSGLESLLLAIAAEACMKNPVFILK